MDGIKKCLPFFALFILSSFCMRFCHGGDTLRRGESIWDQVKTSGHYNTKAQNLVSANEKFELGFFSPPNSNKHYVGIWYKQIKERTIVWVANRNTPMVGCSASLTINNNADLMIMCTSLEKWKMDSSTISILHSSKSTAAHLRLKLLDSGNLVLTVGISDDDHEGDPLWQSFDNPSDTFLPGMKFRRSTMMLMSWRSRDDPSPGDFMLKLDMDASGPSQFLVLQGRKLRKWSSGFWNGQFFSFVPEMRSNQMFDFSFDPVEDGPYFSYSVRNSSILSRLVMDGSGQIKLFTWSEKTEEWRLLWSQPRGVCDVYARCGPNGFCDDSMSPQCACLHGFEPRSRRDWSLGLWSSGCVRRAPLICEGRNEFKPMEMMMLPAPRNIFERLDHKACKEYCRSDCSCAAYASGNGTVCYLWQQELLGLRKSSNNGQDLYVRVTDAELDQGTKSKLWIIAPVAVPSILLGLGTIMFYRRRRVLVRKRRELKRKGKRETSEEAFFFNLGIDKATTHKSGTPSQNVEFEVFDLATISAATNNFSLANKLGEGGFGPVYKGKFHRGREIAVKRLSQYSGQGLEEFKTEIMVIAKLQHTNLVQLLGCCIEGEEKILVYEYMPNRSLDSFLFDPNRRKLLDWEKRHRIIDGVTQGLLYLHKYSRLRIIHRDLKASNILLDCEMNPKISDFGMAKIFGPSESQANTTRVVGTYGYMSPEYAMQGLFSEKSDVFSFGVLLLEIISGKKNTGFNRFHKSLNLLGYAWELWKDGMCLELIDTVLLDTSPLCQLMRWVHIGLLCVQEHAVDRPNMSNVVALLSNETLPLLAPKRPAFSLGRNSSETNPGTCSLNLMTVSAMEAR